MTALYTHPTYSGLKEDWEVYRDLYQGKHSILSSSKYLHLHALESIPGNTNSENLRKAREQRTRYLNTVEIIVSLWQSFFFRKAPNPDPSVLKMLGDDYKNIDGKGNSLFSFIKNEVLKCYLLNGRVDVFADSPQGQPRSRRDQKVLGLRPFLEVIEPLSRKDWDVEANDPKRVGLYNMLRYEYLVYLPRSNSSEEPTYQYRTKVLRRDNDRYVIDIYGAKAEKGSTPAGISEKNDWTIISTIETNLEELPVSYAEDTSWLHDVCHETIRFHNIRSMKDNINFFQGYSKTFIIGEQDKKTEKALTEFTVSFLDEGSNVLFGPVITPTGLENSEKESIVNIFRLGLNQLRHLPLDSKETQSADAVIEEKWNTLALVESTLQEIEGVIDRSLYYYAQLKGVRDFEGSINLNKDIDEKDFNQFITAYSTFGDKLSKYPEIEKSVLKQAVLKLGFDEAETKKALNAIEKGAIKTTEDNTQNDPVQSALNG